MLSRKSRRIKKEKNDKIENILLFLDDENNDPIARLKAQAAENVKNNKTISPVEIKSISELTRLTDKLFKFALDQKNEDGYNSIKCLGRVFEERFYFLCAFLL